MYQIRALIRNAKVKDRAPTAADALRMLRDTQARSGVTSCNVLRNGVIVSPADLEREARQERG